MIGLLDNSIIRSSDHPDIGSSVTRACVHSIALTHFRNYHSSRIELDGAPSVVLIGPNGAGKTNLLEAISLLTPGRGFRRAALADMDNVEDNASWSVSAEIYGPRGAIQVGTGRDPEGGEDSNKRIVRMDGKNAKAQTDLAKVFAALWLTPQMDNLFIEGGTARRKFLDRLVYSFDDEQASRINAYELAMRERNRLLAMGRADQVWLSALEQKMAEQGIAIAVARQQAVDGLMMAMRTASHPFPKASVRLMGAVENFLQEGAALAAENAFRDLLAANRAQDAASGRALCGIHRTQMEVVHIEKNMVAERCSTGEQKAILVSLILSQAGAGALWHGRVPVLLLDEVSTHLDAGRRAALYEALTSTGAQCWLTGTDREMFEGFPAMHIAVQAGKTAFI